MLAPNLEELCIYCVPLLPWKHHVDFKTTCWLSSISTNEVNVFLWMKIHVTFVVCDWISNLSLLMNLEFCFRAYNVAKFVTWDKQWSSLGCQVYTEKNDLNNIESWYMLHWDSFWNMQPWASYMLKTNIERKDWWLCIHWPAANQTWIAIKFSEWTHVWHKEYCICKSNNCRSYV